MVKALKISENFSLRYSAREDQTGDTNMDCSIEFDNPKDDSVIIHRLNTWLRAIGRSNIVVAPTEFTRTNKE